jgi:lauroyl/myristoyl acyltransferase
MQLFSFVVSKVKEIMVRITGISIKGLLWTLGVFLAILPARCVEFFSILLGRVFYYTFYVRRRTILSNLDHAFPERSWSWKRHVGKISCGRMIEMGCLALAAPFFTEARIRRNTFLSEKLKKLSTEISSHLRPIILWIPHLSMLESATWLPLFLPMHFFKMPIGVLFRPLKNRHLISRCFRRALRTNLDFKLRKRTSGTHSLQKRMQF